jgi:hypothetical protein
LTKCITNINFTKSLERSLKSTFYMFINANVLSNLSLREATKPRQRRDLAIFSSYECIRIARNDNANLFIASAIVLA